MHAHILVRRMSASAMRMATADLRQTARRGLRHLQYPGSAANMQRAPASQIIANAASEDSQGWLSCQAPPLSKAQTRETQRAEATLSSSAIEESLSSIRNSHVAEWLENVAMWKGIGNTLQERGV